MKEVSVSKLKAACLELLRIVEETGEPVLVTKHGRAVAKSERLRRNAPRALSGA